MQIYSTTQLQLRRHSCLHKAFTVLNAPIFLMSFKRSLMPTYDHIVNTVEIVHVERGHIEVTVKLRREQWNPSMKLTSTLQLKTNAIANNYKSWTLLELYCITTQLYAKSNATDFREVLRSKVHVTQASFIKYPESYRHMKPKAREDFKVCLTKWDWWAIQQKRTDSVQQKLRNNTENRLRSDQVSSPRKVILRPDDTICSTQLSSTIAVLAKLEPTSIKVGSEPVVNAFSLCIVVVGGSAMKCISTADSANYCE